MKAVRVAIILVVVASVSAMKRPVLSKDMAEMLKKTANPSFTALHSSRRERRDAEEDPEVSCKEADKEWKTCFKTVTEERYSRSNFVARKACNAIGKLLDCHDKYVAACSDGTEVDLVEVMDQLEEEGLKPFAKTLNDIPEFDGRLCPAYRHIVFGEPRGDGGNGATTPLLNLVLPTFLLLALRKM